MDKKWAEKKKQMELIEVSKKENRILDIINKEDFSDREKEKLLYYLNKHQFINLPFSYAVYLHNLKNNSPETNERKIKEVKEICEKLDTFYRYPEWYNFYDRYVDSNVIEFDGDIIITDPSYIEKDTPEVGQYPNREDFFSYEKESDYPDYQKLTTEEIEKIILELAIDPSVIYKSKQYQEEEKAYNKAIEIYQENNLSDWEKCECGKNMEVLGLKHYITHDTIYGDWSCTTFNTDTNEVLGHFCADAGLVSVFLLDEVLKYNPDFDYHLNRDWTTTWIKDFKGTVQIVIEEEEFEYSDKHGKNTNKGIDYSVHVIGHGINEKTGKPINFRTTQTGL